METKHETIFKGLKEVLNKKLVEKILDDEKRELKIYWGTSPTGKPHLGYFVPLLKLGAFLKAGCNVKILLADLHAFLDNNKSTLEIVHHRVEYYEIIIKLIFKSLNINIDKLEFIVGSSFQLKPDYMLDLLKLTNFSSQNDAKRAGADVVKQTENPKLSGLIYPLMQALDEQYLDVDVQFGGLDQRKIFVLAEEKLPLLNYKKRAHFMNPIISGLTQDGKMSSSEPNSIIDVLDDQKTVKKKISSAFCSPQEINKNSLIEMIEHILLPIHELKGNDSLSFIIQIDRPVKYGGPVTYNSIAEMKNAYSNNLLSPVDLKSYVFKMFDELLDPIRNDFYSNPKYVSVLKNAYPASSH